jgi:acyl-CoA dehydrogenase
MDQPVVRHRLAKCAAMLEAQSAWIEQFAYQLSHLSKDEGDKELGGLTALCKANAGIVMDECARCAVLLFGGNGFTRTGQGMIAESEFPHSHIALMDMNVRSALTMSTS